ncbi:unnamed protein product [Zymoseptoria tritici ST99CH_1E4]|uniref:Uncharacterized protein n=1 Tax=Zymoseptoria tritici ST99CH_1E4 TaxID=1276532 RepID=A0A2H1H9P9_ZYMTR|nr:unnamed protein product [Zymoseptoria tritici ST99CH_1E4]
MSREDEPAVLTQQRELSRLGNDAEAIKEAAKQSVNTYRTQCQTYAIKEKKYEKQQSRIVNTRTAILSPLDKAIHDRVAHITSPKILYDTIVSIVRMSASQAQQMGYTLFSSAQFSSATGVSSYINKIKNIQQRITAAGGDLNDTQLIVKLLEHLPGEYRDFIRTWEQCASIPNIPRDINTLQAQLLGEEARLALEKSRKPTKAETNDKNNDKDKRKNSKERLQTLRQRRSRTH